MKYSEQIKPISYVKAHAAEILDRLRETQEPLIITQNGEAKAVLQDIKSYETMQETIAMLQIVAQAEHDIAEGKLYSIEESFERIRKQLDNA